MVDQPPCGPQDRWLPIMLTECAHQGSLLSSSLHVPGFPRVLLLAPGLRCLGVSPFLGLVVLSLKWEQHSICLTSHSQRGDAYSGKGLPFEGINQNSESEEEAGRTPLTKFAHFSYTTGDYTIISSHI